VTTSHAGPIQRKVARVRSEGEDISQELAVIEYVASEYAPAWLRLAQLESEVGRDAEAIRAVNRYLEVRPDDEKGWLQLIELYRAAEDSLAECMPDCSSPNWGARRSIT
jgi:predicted TPR repeat methyltransferase